MAGVGEIVALARLKLRLVGIRPKTAKIVYWNTFSKSLGKLTNLTHLQMMLQRNHIQD